MTLREGQVSRRGFLVVSALAGGGLMLSLRPSVTDAVVDDAFTPNAFLSIGSDGVVTVTVPVVEMGQGTFTSLPMLIAEELDVGLSSIRTAHAPPNNKLFGNPVLGGQQVTGASTSMRAWYLPLRKAGATARAMLVSAAAQRWRVPPSECETLKGVVSHKPSGRSASYGSLAARAASQPVPAEVPLKDPKEFRLIGTSAGRLDIAAKVDGSARFGIDAHVPGMKLAGVIACPVFGGKVRKVDDAKARAVRGVREIIVLEAAVAVVADHMGAVRKGLAALDVVWDEGPHASFSTEAWRAQLREAAKGKGMIAVNEGDAAKSIASAPDRFTATYEAPNLAHATLEPMNCTVRLTPTTCEIWTGTQVPTGAQGVAARVAGLPLEKVTLHNFMLGGGFGRRLETDYVEQAVRIAQKASTPVKVIWSREEDTRHDAYRPCYYDELAVGIDEKGTPVAFSHRLVGGSVIARFAGGVLPGIDIDAVDAAESPYDFEHRYVEFVRSEAPAAIPIGFWRGVGPNHNAWVVEGFIDELAVHLQRDPVEFRRSLLRGKPRARTVLDKVAKEIGWGRPLQRRVGRGVALVSAWESFAALAVEAAVDESGHVSLKRLVAAVDCGQPINPDGVVAQIESGVIFGLTAALYGNITIENGRVLQGNFHEYRMVRMPEVPPFEVHLIPSGEKPGGVGEIGTTLPSPALVNAIFAATGVRLRRLPIDPEVLRAT